MDRNFISTRGSIGQCLICRILISPIFFHLKENLCIWTCKRNFQCLTVRYGLSVYRKSIPFIIKSTCSNFYGFCILSHCYLIIPCNTGTVKFWDQIFCHILIRRKITSDYGKIQSSENYDLISLAVCRCTGCYCINSSFSIVFGKDIWEIVAFSICISGCNNLIFYSFSIKITCRQLNRWTLRRIRSKIGSHIKAIGIVTGANLNRISLSTICFIQIFPAGHFKRIFYSVTGIHTQIFEIFLCFSCSDFLLIFKKYLCRIFICIFRTPFFLIICEVFHRNLSFILICICFFCDLCILICRFFCYFAFSQIIRQAVFAGYLWWKITFYGYVRAINRCCSRQHSHWQKDCKPFSRSSHLMITSLSLSQRCSNGFLFFIFLKLRLAPVQKIR